jgi:hypothetical protein
MKKRLKALKDGISGLQPRKPVTRKGTPAREEADKREERAN